jgi:5,10-methylenetetrahydromethanopterin reductase
VGQVTELRTGVWFQGGLPVGDAVDLARTAENAGVDAVWVAEGPVARDAFITLTAIAVATDRVELATGVTNPFTRHPAQLAASFATLDEVSGGRAVCGLGIGARDHLARLDADLSKPLTAAREMLTLVRGLLAREVVDLDGAKFSVHGVRLGFKPPRETIPIFLAATGPKMCELAGEMDGIYLLYGTREYLRRAIGYTEKSRTPEREFRVASPVLLAVDDDPEVAREGLKVGIGLALTEPSGEAMLEANGMDPALVQPIRDGLATQGVRGVAAAVDNSIVDRLAIAGTHAECVERLAEAVDAGITQPQVLLANGDPRPELAVLNELKQVAA